MKKNTTMIIGIIIFAIGAIMVLANIGEMQMHPEKLIGTVLFAGMVYRFIKTEYCKVEAE